MTTFTPFAPAYSNHIGGGFTHPVTGAVYFLVTFRLNSAGPYRLQVWEDAAPYGDPKMIREWVTGTPESGPGPWAYGTCTWLPNGSLYIAVPGGVIDGTKVQPSIHIEAGLFPPIPLGAGVVTSPLVIPPQLPPNEGGEIILLAGDGGQPWHIDVFHDTLRFHIGGVVVAEWKKPPIV